MVIMDITDQITIDNLDNCKVFIGACSNSVFIRNCSNCTFYTCCRQLRLRDVTETKFYVYSQAEVHIEFSNKVQFAPFNGGYPEQEAHFVEARLNVEENLWYDIFDHNDADKTGQNWSLMLPSEYGEPWFPGETCTPYVPVTAVGSVAKEDKDQVGESFGADQMRADSAAIGVKAMEKAVEEVPLEAALLVSYGKGKGVNVSEWLDVPPNKPADFNERFISLGQTMSYSEEPDVKAELDLATSAENLKMIESLCGSSSKIDVNMFLNACEEKVQRFMSPIKEELSESVPYLSSTGMGDSEAISKDSSPSSTNRNVLGSVRSVTDTIDSNEILLESQVTPSKARGGMSIETNDLAVDGAIEAILPSSPYDEQVTFDVDMDEDVNTLDSRYKNQRRAVPRSSVEPKAKGTKEKKGKSAVSKGTTSPTKVGGGRGTLSAPKQSGPVRSTSAAKKPTSTLLEANMVPEIQQKVPKNKDSLSKSGKFAIQGNEIKGGSFGRAPRAGVAESPMRNKMQVKVDSSAKRRAGAKKASNVAFKASPAKRSVARLSVQSALTSSSLSGDLSTYVEACVRDVVQKTDFYHIIQVRLGFVDGYRYNPPRGEIIDSKARPWLSTRELLDAMYAVRLYNFKDAHIFTLMKLVAAFKRYSDNFEGVEEDEGEETENVYNPSARLLNAEWVKKYFVFLRLTKHKNRLTDSINATIAQASEETKEGIADPDAPPPAPAREFPLRFSEWNLIKRIEAAKDKTKKPKEFRRALAGRECSLSHGELFEFINENTIVPSDIMKQEITQRLQAWVLDIDGRKDYIHALNVAKRKWSVDNKTEIASLGQEEQKDTLSMIKSQVVRKKATQLRVSEADEGSVTKELFVKYRKYCKEMKYHRDRTLTWGKWLQTHLEAQTDIIKKSRMYDAEREKLLQSKDTRKSAVAPLIEIEKKLLFASDNLSTIHGIELRKSLVKLKKAAKQANIGKGELITKEMFDQYVGDVIAPRLKELPDSQLKGLAEEARRWHESVGQTNKTDARFADGIGMLFNHDEEAAIAKSREMKEEDEKKVKAEFQLWETKKLEKKKLAQEVSKKQGEHELKTKVRKQALADRAYNKWLKLRKSGKYLSKVDNKSRHVPKISIVEHDIKWSKDIEVANGEDDLYL
jgi:hypothetical protein